MWVVRASTEKVGAVHDAMGFWVPVRLPPEFWAGIWGQGEWGCLGLSCVGSEGVLVICSWGAYLGPMCQHGLCVKQGTFVGVVG